MAFGAPTRLCKHHLCLIPEHSVTPKGDPGPTSCLSRLSSSSPQRRRTHFLSLRTCRARQCTETAPHGVHPSAPGPSTQPSVLEGPMSCSGGQAVLPHYQWVTKSPLCGRTAVCPSSTSGHSGCPHLWLRRTAGCTGLSESSHAVLPRQTHQWAGWGQLLVEFTNRVGSSPFFPDRNTVKGPHRPLSGEVPCLYLPQVQGPLGERVVGRSPRQPTLRDPAYISLGRPCLGHRDGKDGRADSSDLG